MLTGDPKQQCTGIPWETLDEKEKTGKSYDKLAKQFGVSKATVADLIKRKTWKNV